MKNNRFSVAYRRKREGKTDYRARLNLLISGKPRLVVRKSVNNIYAQIIKFDPKGDIVIAEANSNEIASLGWKYNRKNIPCAYLVGCLIANKAKAKKVPEAILDIGLNQSVKGCKLYAVAKGASDNGLKVPISKEIVPSEDRIKGKHIYTYKKISEKDFADNFNSVLAKVKGGK